MNMVYSSVNKPFSRFQSQWEELTKIDINSESDEGRRRRQGNLQKE